MSGSETNPDGYDIDEGIEFAKALDGKVDIIHVSTGNHEVTSASIKTHPSMFAEDGCNLKYAAAIKKHVKSLVASVGAHTEPELMEEIVASGQADIFVLGSQALADPYLPKRQEAAGRGDQHMPDAPAALILRPVQDFLLRDNPKMGMKTRKSTCLRQRRKRRCLLSAAASQECRRRSPRMSAATV
jgi:hypothetical protein